MRLNWALRNEQLLAGGELKGSFQVGNKANAHWGCRMPGGFLGGRLCLTAPVLLLAPPGSTSPLAGAHLHRVVNSKGSWNEILGWHLLDAGQSA